MAVVGVVEFVANWSSSNIRRDANLIAIWDIIWTHQLPNRGTGSGLSWQNRGKGRGSPKQNRSEIESWNNPLRNLMTIIKYGLGWGASRIVKSMHRGKGHGLQVQKGKKGRLRSSKTWCRSSPRVHEPCFLHWSCCTGSCRWSTESTLLSSCASPPILWHRSCPVYRPRTELAAKDL